MMIHVYLLASGVGEKYPAMERRKGSSLPFLPNFYSLSLKESLSLIQVDDGKALIPAPPEGCVAHLRSYLQVQLSGTYSTGFVCVRPWVHLQHQRQCTMSPILRCF
jgi:hypothetical protein